MIDSLIICILQCDYKCGLTTQEILDELRAIKPLLNFDYQNILNRCIRLVNNGIAISTRNKHDAILYKIT